MKPYNIGLGYGIIKEERRKEFTAEACSNIISRAFSQEKENVITARCLINNFRAINLLQKINFKEVKVENDTLYWSFISR